MKKWFVPWLCLASFFASVFLAHATHVLLLPAKQSLGMCFLLSFISWIFPTQLPANSPQTSARVSPTKREANPFVPLLVVTSNMIFILEPVCQITCWLKLWGSSNWCYAIQQKLWKGNVVSCWRHRSGRTPNKQQLFGCWTILKKDLIGGREKIAKSVEHQIILDRKHDSTDARKATRPDSYMAPLYKTFDK